MQKYKIVLIGSVPPPYHGSNIYFQNLLNSKISNEFEIFHLDSSDHRDLTNINKLDLLNVYLAIKNIIQLVIKLKKNKPDLVYIPNSATILPYLRDGTFIIISSWFSKAKIIIHLHGGGLFRDEFYNKSNFLTKLFIRYSLSKATAAIVLGENLKYIFNGLVKKTFVLANGSEIDIKNIETSKNGNEKIKINYLGNLFKSKGVLDFLHAAKIVLGNKNNIEFNLAGSWWDQEPNTKIEAVDFINRNNYHSTIKFIGKVIGENKNIFLNTTDIFVFPSINEGFPIVILEAMAAGCPVISTKDVGAIPEVVLDGETGILVEKNNPIQIADAIIKLIEDPELRIKMGKAGRKRFEEYFTMEKNIDNLISIFNEILES